MSAGPLDEAELSPECGLKLRRGINRPVTVDGGQVPVHNEVLTRRADAFPAPGLAELRWPLFPQGGEPFLDVLTHEGEHLVGS